MDRILYLIRGCSGSGKSTLALQLLQLPNSVAFAADDYHTDEDGNYVWQLHNISKAHDWCKRQVENSMESQVSNVIVHNTNTSEKEIKPYLDLAVEYGYKVISLVVEKRHKCNNVHEVSLATIARQSSRLRGSIKID